MNDGQYLLMLRQLCGKFGRLKPFGFTIWPDILHAPELVGELLRICHNLATVTKAEIEAYSPFQ